MGTHIPQAVEPHFNSIINQANEHPWLVNFYLVEIRNKITHCIEQELFNSHLFQEKFPHGKRLDKLFLLKGFFDDAKKSDFIYDPLRKAFKDLSSIHKLLQDTWFKAMASRDGHLNLQEGLPSYTREVLSEVLSREIMLYIKRKAKNLRYLHNPLKQKRLESLKYWLKKELHHAGPVTKPFELDTQRFTKIHDPSHFEIDIGVILGNVWYFINGVDRLPLFLQYELITLKHMFLAIKDITYALSAEDKNFKRNLLIGLPMSGLKFLFNVMYLMFIPYRFARTMINELSLLFKQGMEVLWSKLGFEGRQQSNVVKGLGVALEWLCYGSLLWLFGLPIIPNPFVWMPEVPVVFLFIGFTGYLFTVTASACAIALTSLLSTSFFSRFEKSVEKVEAQVEKGLQAVDDVHQQIFNGNVKTYHPLFDASQQLKPVPSSDNMPEFKQYPKR